MQLIINGKEQEIERAHTVRDLLEYLDLDLRYKAVAVNFEVVPRDQFATRRLNPGDSIEIVQAIGGG